MHIMPIIPMAITIIIIPLHPRLFPVLVQWRRLAIPPECHPEWRLMPRLGSVIRLDFYRLYSLY